MNICIVDRGIYSYYEWINPSDRPNWSFEIELSLEDEIAHARDGLVAYREWLEFLEDKQQTEEALEVLANLPRTELPAGGLRRLSEVADEPGEVNPALHGLLSRESIFDGVPGPVIEALEQNPRVWDHILHPEES